MPKLRPLECPICGHERLERRLQQQEAAPDGRLRGWAVTWTCGLCAYSWSEPLVPPSGSPRKQY